MKTNLAHAANFLRRHSDMTRHWPRERLLDWLDWFARDARLALCHDICGRLVGVGLARACHESQAKDWFSHDEKSGAVWVDLIALTDPRAMPCMAFALHHRFGPRQWIAFRRAKDASGRVRRYAYEKFLQHMINKKGLVYGNSLRTHTATGAAGA
jgi:hypothetical protein